MRGDSGEAGGYGEADVGEAAEFYNYAVDLLGVGPLRIEDGFRVVEEDDHLPRGQKGLEGNQSFRVFDARTNDLGESVEKMGTRSGEPVAANESTIVAKSLLDAIVMEDFQRDGRLADSPGAYECDGFEVFRKTNDLLN
jgi:hypothetical protein